MSSAVAGQGLAGVSRRSGCELSDRTEEGATGWPSRVRWGGAIAFRMRGERNWGRYPQPATMQIYA